MNAMEYQLWMRKAFLYVEAALCQELATPSRVCMTEDYFRSALVRGLASSRPDIAHRIDTEHDAQWSKNKCWRCGSTSGQRRPIQHDIAIMANQTDRGLLCEVKWFKAANSKAVARDVWKLLMSRGTEPEQQATRTYLLLGGEGAAFSSTLATLRANHVNLRWSNAGRQRGPPGTHHFSVARYLSTSLGATELEYVLGWGQKPRHRRTPPKVWASMRLSRRSEPWVRTVDGTGWRATMLELHHHGAANSSHLDLAHHLGSLSFHC